ncbi:MAG TPA: formimidoylglutamase [Gemmataceae bacterium]
MRPGRAVLVGFPQDEGVRRNGGRAGAAGAPDALRRFLYRLTTWDPETGADLPLEPPLDAGNVRVTGGLEESQSALAEVVGAVLGRGAVPVVLGGGHETAYGVYLGYVAARRPVGIVNIDAHLDVRPLVDGLGHSGSPFRQAMEHPATPLPGNRYACLGAQPHATSREHWNYVHRRGGVVRRAGELQPSLTHHLLRERDRMVADGATVHLTIDADAVRASDVPGVSAPNPTGLPGSDVVVAARAAGLSPAVSSLDLVEINPRFDPDDRSARWGAVLIWNFLVGVQKRTAPPK